MVSAEPERPLFPTPREQPFAPPAMIAEIRESATPVSPVQLYDGTPAWLVTRYDDVRTVLGDARFSSKGVWRFQSSASRAAAERTETSLTAMDPPEHTRYRRMLTRHFTVRRVEEMRPDIERIVAAALDELEAARDPDGVVDLVSAFALPVASRTMGHVLGVPYADHQWYEQRSEVRSRLDADPDDAAQATKDLIAYVDGLVEQKATTPADDLTTRLVAELLVDGGMTRDELVATIRLLLTAGHETTGTMIGTGTFVLLQHPEHLAALLTAPDKAGPTVEELLRYLSILHSSIVRVATDDLTLSGCPVAHGDGLIATPAQANKDPRKFVEPDRFDPDRDTSGHLAFGFGVHQCLGQAIARLEMRIALVALFTRFPTLRLAVAPEAVRYQHSNLIGVEALPVTWDADDRRRDGGA